MLLNKSFSRRVGKGLSSSQKELLEFELPKFLLNEASLLANMKEYEEIIIEIGFGMGEHFINQISLNPKILYIGAEPYLNGIANTLKLARMNNLSNFLIWPDDLDIVLDIIPKKVINGIYLLFPDPWPKRNQSKRRILNQERLSMLKSKLIKNGFFIFASDVQEYFEAAKNLIISDSSLRLSNDDFLEPHEGYITTKYHRKAIIENRIARFFKSNLIE